MKSIVDFFRRPEKDCEPEPKKNCNSMEPRYYRKDLEPPELKSGEYETKQEQLYRFGELHPVTVLHEVANQIGGEVTRVDPKNNRSTPIVLKSTSRGMTSIVFYKTSLQFTIYQIGALEIDRFAKNTITNRESIYGLQKAYEMIEKGEYDKVFEKNKL